MAELTVPIEGVHLASEGNDLVVRVLSQGAYRDVIREDWRALPDGGEIYHAVTSLGLDALIRGEQI